jgi:PAS domain S-box-containing protein
MFRSPEILKASILIVDDNAAYVALLEQMLHGAGYTAVASTGNSQAVCALCGEHRHDLILLNLHMPGRDGFQVIADLKANEAADSPPVVVITAQPELKLRALEAGAKDFISIPFDLMEVLLRVQNILEVRLLHRKLTSHNSARLDNAQRIARLGDWEYDFVSDHLVWSDGIYRILGVSREDTPPNSESFYRQVHPDDLARVRQEKQAAAAGTRRADFEHRIINPQGEVRYIHQIAELTFDENGRPTGESGTIQDITARVRSGEIMRQKEAQFDSLASTVPDHIYFKDRASRYVWINKLMAQDLGLSGAAEAVGKSDADIFSAEHAQQAYADEQKLMASGEPLIGLEEKETWPDGRANWVSSTKVPTRDKEGRITGLVGISRDITAHKQMEEQLRHAQRLEAIGSLASGVAHDMNNILAPMLMAAGILKDKLPAERDRAILALVENGAQRGASIIRQLLAFSSGIEGARTQVQLRHLLKEMEHLMQETFPRSIRIEQTIANDLGEILADATQMHQVVMNLCVNARDAMPEGGVLTMNAENIRLDAAMAQAHPGAKPGPYIVVTVTDTGTGIPAEIIERIFDPFFTTKVVGKGTGLGLSMAIGIVKSHDGFITVDSRPGLGTTFKVYLPAAGSPAAAKVEASQAPFPAGNEELILVVDDEDPILMATSGVLTFHHYRVITARSGEEAIRLFIRHSESVSLVLTDIMMPGIEGIELIRSLRIIKPDIRVIATTGLEQVEDRAAFTALGVTEILAKPCLPVVLLKAVNQALAK